MKNNLLILMTFLCIPLIAAGVAYAGPDDPHYAFSLDDDDTVAGGVNGDIYSSPEDGTFGLDFNIPMGTTPGILDSSAEVDALSGYHTGDHSHDVSLEDMYFGTYKMLYSVDSDSNIFEWNVGGPPPAENETNKLAAQGFVLPGRTISFDPNDNIYVTAADLGLKDYDLDALESYEHDAFPGTPTDWEDHVGVYFSVESSTLADDGDVYEQLTGLYLDDSRFGPVVGFDPDTEQMDALIVFDIFTDKKTFDGGNDLLNSDAIFFSLAPGTHDQIGDNIYWYSAAFGGVGGLYADPDLEENVDALDVPEPATMLLLGSGLLGLAGFSRKKFNKS